MKSNEIRAKLNHWSFPRGPFRPVEQIYGEMEMNARCMGPKAAPELAKILVALDEEEDPLEEDLYQYLQIYAKFYPNACCRAVRVESHVRR